MRTRASALCVSRCGLLPGGETKRGEAKERLGDAVRCHLTFLEVFYDVTSGVRPSRSPERAFNPPPGRPQAGSRPQPELPSTRLGARFAAALRARCWHLELAARVLDARRG